FVAGNAGNLDATADLYRGDAAKPAGQQWQHIVADFAGGTVPHADSRDMMFDANGNLLESNDGGIYRLTNPELLPNPAPRRRWTAVVGNLQLAEVHAVGYDPVNNLSFLGTQDNGTEV